MNETLLYTSNYGIKFLRFDYKKRSKVCVYSYDNNGNHYNLRTYRMNNVPFYNHPYLSWENLNCCNGWSYDESYLYTAVQNNKKLIAQATFDINSPSEDPKPAMQKFQQIVPNLDKTKVNVVIEMGHTYGPNNNGGLWHTIIIRRGCLADFFNLSEIKAEYAKHDFYFSDELEKELAELFKVELTDLYKERSEHFYRLQSVLDCIITGLCFGYPLESTVDIIMG